MMNRHGLIAGATGTGKTRTLQLLAEQLSDAGVPVFMPVSYTHLDVYKRQHLYFLILKIPIFTK